MIKYFQKSRFQLLPIVLLLWVMTSCAKPNQKIVVGERISNFNVVQLSGANRDVTSLVKGQVALVVFWATWCSRCREEVPHINELATYYRASLVVIGISVGESMQIVKAHTAGLGIQYPVVVAELSNLTKLGINHIPLLLLLDAKGQVQQIENSVNESLRERIEQIIARNDSLAN